MRSRTSSTTEKLDTQPLFFIARGCAAEFAYVVEFMQGVGRYALAGCWKALMADINAIVESLKSSVKDLPLPITVVAVLGALSVLGVVLQTVGAFYRFFLRPGKDLKKLGSYAVVTGATGTLLA
jgi:hypothetical protein